MTERSEWGRHVMEAHPELANVLKRFNEMFDARVVKMEVVGDPKASWGQEQEWQRNRTIIPCLGKIGARKVEKYKNRNIRWK